MDEGKEEDNGRQWKGSGLLEDKWYLQTAFDDAVMGCIFSSLTTKDSRVQYLFHFQGTCVTHLLCG